MLKVCELTFRIDAFTPNTLPMAKLAAYMTDLAVLLGEPESVHFAGLVEGSVALVHCVHEPAMPKVRARLISVRRNEGPSDAMKAFARLDRRLADDNAVATLCEFGGAEIIRFPGRDTPRPLDYPRIRQRGSLDGILRRTGSEKDPPKLMLVDGDKTWNCEATWELIEQIDQYKRKRIRVHGEGKWKRSPDGEWDCERFRVESFDVLDDATWGETAIRLQAAAPAAWTDNNDLLSDLADLRGSEETVH